MVKKMFDWASEGFTTVGGELFRNGRRVGSKDNRGYIRYTFKKKYYMVHRIIFQLVNGYLPEFVDHINGKRDDNRPENLREVTHAQNMMNKGTNRGIRLVCHGQNGKEYYVAQITKDGKQIQTMKNTYDKALAWRKEKEEELFGEYRRQENV